MAKKKAKAKKKVEKTEEQEQYDPTDPKLLKQALKTVKGEKKAGYDRIVGVVEASPEGRPLVVTVKCIDPQVDGDGNSVCAKTRDVKIQDVFQVTRCEPCQARYVQIYRNRLARERRAELRKLKQEKASSKKKGNSRPKSKKKTAAEA